MRRELKEAVARLQMAIEDLYLGSVESLVVEAAVDALTESWSDHNPQKDDMSDMPICEFSNRQAYLEGWGLFNGNEIQRLDTGAIRYDGSSDGVAVFSTDEHAFDFVRKCADEGSAYHKEALKLASTTP